MCGAVCEGGGGAATGASLVSQLVWAEAIFSAVWISTSSHVSVRGRRGEEEESGGGGAVELGEQLMGWRAAAMTLLCPVMVQRARASTHCPKQGPSCSHCHSSCHDTDNKAFCEVSCVQGYHAETTWKNGVHENAYQCLNGDWVAYKDGVSGPDCQPDAGWCAGYNPTGLGVQIDDPNCARDYGQKCSVNCGETFRPAGLPGHRIASRDYVCGTEHQWAPVVGGHDLQCVKVCPVDPEENAAFASHCTHDVDEECIARCDPGYASDSSLSTLAYVCNGNGEWMPARDGARLNCSLSGCPMFRIENAHHCPANDVGSTCEVSCEVGTPRKHPLDPKVGMAWMDWELAIIQKVVPAR